MILSHVCRLFTGWFLVFNIYLTFKATQRDCYHRTPIVRSMVLNLSSNTSAHPDCLNRVKIYRRIYLQTFDSSSPQFWIQAWVWLLCRLYLPSTVQYTLFVWNSINSCLKKLINHHRKSCLFKELKWWHVLIYHK